MSSLDDFMLFNACEVAHEEQKAQQTVEYPSRCNSGRVMTKVVPLIGMDSLY